MRQFALFALLVTLAVGCNRNKPADPADPGNSGQGGPTTPTPAPPVDTAARDRAHWLNNIKSTNQKTRAEAIDQLSIWAETDPEAVAALVELLKDKTTAGAGKTLPTQVNSTREAAARALQLAGAKGEAALKDKGLAALREGLNDPNPVIREHTAYTVGLLGPIARPLSPDLLKLCPNPDANVRGAAFDALRSVGVTDAAGLAALLTHENAEVGKLAAELVPGLADVPDAAVPALTKALESDVEQIRTASAAGLALAGPKAAPAAAALADAVKKTPFFLKEFDPESTYEAGSELAFWRALSRIGAPAATPTAALLAYKHPVVRTYAAQTLGEIGPPAKPAADKLKEALKDSFGAVAVEAACALCRIGEGQAEAVELVKRALDGPNDVPQTAIEAIPRMGKDGAALHELAVAKLTSGNAYARYAAVGFVGALPPAEAAKHAAAVVKLATDNERLVRRRVGAVLEKLGPAAASAAPALGEALPNEKDDVVRDQFIDALIAMGPGAKPALPALLALATERNVPLALRTRVIAAVAVAGPASPDVSAKLIEAAGDADQEARVAAAAAIAQLKPLPADALNKLVAMAKSDSKDVVRVAALRALAVAGDRAKPARAEVQQIADGPVPGFALRAKVAVAAMDGNLGSAAAAVRAGLADKNPQVRAGAAESLLVIGPTAADLPALLKLLKDVGSDTKESAAKCVGRLGPAAKEAVPQLIRLLDDTRGHVRAAAAAALGDIGPAAMPAVEKLKVLRGNRNVSDAEAGPAARKALEKLGVREKQ